MAVYQRHLLGLALCLLLGVCALCSEVAGTMIIPVVQMRKLRYGDEKLLAQG